VAPRPAPLERVRARVQRTAGAAVADALPRGFTRLGRVLLLQLPEALRPSFPEIGAAYAAELGCGAVLRRGGPVAGEYRRPTVELLFGSETETVVQEHGVRWRFDAREVMFARGNKEERARVGRLVGPGERVVDLFAGIGYLTIPAARAHPSVRVTAVEVNPTAYRYLLENLRLNGVAGQVRALRGDNRELELPAGEADRVLLGFLPSAVPWVGRAWGLLKPGGGTLHVHTVGPVDAGAEGAAAEVAEALTRCGAPVRSLRPRAVKPYGPGRTHFVVDAVIGPGRGP